MLDSTRKYAVFMVMKEKYLFLFINRVIFYLKEQHLVEDFR